MCNDCIKDGKLVHLGNLTFDMNRETQEVEQEKTCKYLKIEKSESIQYQQTLMCVIPVVCVTNWRG